tara:strand:+ start:110 stop:304 length:195 start_codon:yes stop_codon:yes gene_type:complete
MLSEKQTRSEFDTSSVNKNTSRKSNLVASLEVSDLKFYNKTETINFGLLDVKKKKEQFLTIDRF